MSDVVCRLKQIQVQVNKIQPSERTVNAMNWTPVACMT